MIQLSINFLDYPERVRQQQIPGLVAEKFIALPSFLAVQLEQIFNTNAPGASLLLDGDVAINAPFQNLQGLVVVGTAFWNGDMDIPNISNIGGGNGQVCVTSDAYYGVGAIWGTGALNVHVGGDLGYSGTTATAAFLKLSGLTLDGATTANAFNFAVNPGVWNTNISLTPANLDAAISSGGFGGIAYGNLGTKIRQIA